MTNDQARMTNQGSSSNVHWSFANWSFIGHSGLVIGHSVASSLDHGQHVVFDHDHQLFAVELDFGAGVAGEDDLVALLDVDRRALAGVEALAFTDGQHGAALGLFLGGVREDDPALGFALGLHALHEDLVAEGSKLGHV